MDIPFYSNIVQSTFYTVLFPFHCQAIASSKEMFHSWRLRMMQKCQGSQLDGKWEKVKFNVQKIALDIIYSTQEKQVVSSIFIFYIHREK